MENLATANLTAAILKDNGGYPTSAVLPSADDDAAGSYKHQTSEELATGNLQLSGSPLMTSDGFSSYQFKPPQAHGTHGTSATSSGVDRADEVTESEDDMQTSKMPNAHDIPQHGAAATKPRISPERMTARVLVPESESSQEDEIHVGRHNASQSSQRRTRTSALLKQLPESRVMGYTTDPAFSEAVHDANLIENCTPAEVEVAAGDSDTGEPERGSDLSVELPSGTAESPRAAEEVSHAQSQSPLPLSNLKSFASPRQSNAPAKSRDSGTLLAHNSQSLPQSLGGHNSKVILSHSRRVEPISEDQFAEMENLPAIDEARDLQHRQITSSKTPLPDCQAPPTPASQNRAAGNSLTRAITSASGSTQTALRVRGLKTVRRAKSDTVSSTPKVGRRIPRATVPSPEGGDLQASGSQNRADSAASKAHKPEHHASPTKAASIENFDHDQDGASSDEPRRSQRKVGASSDRRARLSNGTNVDDVSLLVNRSSPSPVEDLVDASFLDSPNSSQAMDKRKTPLFVSSPPSTQHPAIPSTQDHLPPRMRPGRASQLPPSSRWPSLMSLTTDQVRSAVQHRWNASLGGSSQMNSQNAINNDDANADKSDELDESDGDREKIPT
ncbi:uncharacterized protein EI90DRAFT_3032463 [Cantharellus anzutake]|uniref:uncharacterized protein n=1 Tax=Cantharellus anzutake TaxID=1750568 RepID=UPI001906E333|nr:uncharacterized protein EI90DRAFT_3032463 [Cantharellus anzutake]KAF8342209.1 hypothetical protein EI90DRAFT_3032463 [Cantharellus anzutake]